MKEKVVGWNVKSCDSDPILLAAGLVAMPTQAQYPYTTT